MNISFFFTEDLQFSTDDEEFEEVGSDNDHESVVETLAQGEGLNRSGSAISGGGGGSSIGEEAFVILGRGAGMVITFCGGCFVQESMGMMIVSKRLKRWYN